jgi:zinc transporter ZupT
MSMAVRFLEDLVVDEHDDNHKPWGEVIGASLLINLVTLSGLVLSTVVGCFGRLRNNGKPTNLWSTLHTLVIPSFAAGALLATVVFLLVPEAFELLAHASEEEHVEDDTVVEEEDHEEHAEEAQWKFGLFFLIGFLFPICLGAIFPPPDVSQCDGSNEPEETGSVGHTTSDQDHAKITSATSSSDDENIVKSQELERSESLTRTMDEGCDSGECKHHGHDDNAEEGITKKELPSVDEAGVDSKAVVTAQHHKKAGVNWALATSILVGDAFHNFTDGIFLGTAFVLCSSDIAWTLVATTIYHELAQEIADYALLTHHCGLSRTQAVVSNFLSGLSVMLGAVLVVGLDFSDAIKGGLLAVSAGVYVYIAATECVPRIQAVRKTVKDSLVFLACFTVGAVPIGLVLLNHGHCEAEEHTDHADERWL